MVQKKSTHQIIKEKKAKEAAAYKIIVNNLMTATEACRRIDNNVLGGSIQEDLMYAMNKYQQLLPIQ